MRWKLNQERYILNRTAWNFRSIIGREKYDPVRKNIIKASLLQDIALWLLYNIMIQKKWLGVLQIQDELGLILV